MTQDEHNLAVIGSLELMAKLKGSKFDQLRYRNARKEYIRLLDIQGSKIYSTRFSRGKRIAPALGCLFEYLEDHKEEWAIS